MDAVKRNGAIRRAFVSLFLSVIAVRVGIGIISPILPLYAEQFTASGIQIGFLFSAFSLARLVLAPAIGRLSDRGGRKRWIQAGLVVFAGLSVLYVLASRYWHITLLRILQGAASILVTPLAQAYVGDITPKGHEGRYMNAFYAAMFLGMALGPVLGGTFAQRWSYEAAFYAMGALALVSLVLVGRLVPAKLRKGSADEGPKEIVPLRTVFRNDAVRGIFFYFATRGFWRQGFNTFYPLFAVAAAGLGESQIGLVLSVYMLGGGLLQIPFGWLADRCSRFPQIIIGSLAAPLMLLLIPSVRGLAGAVAVVFLMGAFSALSRASVVAIRTEIGRTHGMGTLAGLHSSAFSTGQLLGPIAFGAIADGFGVQAVFWFGGAVGLIGSIFVFRSFRKWTQGAKQDPQVG